MTLKTFILRFATPIAANEIPLFRGAIIKAVGSEFQLFHNHDGERLRYAYPLVQYKRIGGKAALVFVGEGVDSVINIFGSKTTEIELGSRKVVLELEHADANTTAIRTWDDQFCYTIRKYLPLNQRNYEQYTRADGTIERLQIIERSLVGNILSFAKGIGLHLDDKVEVKTTGISEPHIYIYKGVKMTGFDMEFKTNISLPNYIGLGKGASLGFGMIKRITEKSNNT